ncbi:MAG: membrane protein insertase YidC [Burkholderiales bacterium]|nr:membrane protein insertase YidC [Burkholderiales bacterium]
MDTQRLILFVIFSMSLLFLWEAWQKHQQPPQPVAQQGQPPAAGVPTPSVQATAPAAPAPAPAAPDAAKARELITVATDLVRAQIDLAGGDIVSLDLLHHKDTVDINKPYQLLTPAFRYAMQSGLLGAGLPTHKATYTASAREFKLADGQDRLEVRLETTTPEGIKAAKILTFHRGSYVIDVAQEFTNPKAEPLSAHAYFQLTRDDRAPPGDQAMLQTFTGVGVYTDAAKYQKVSWSDIAKAKTSYPKTAEDGWIGVVQHYFVSALVPPEKTAREYYAREIGKDLFSAGVILPLGEVAPGATATARTRLYAGPQDQDQLKALAPGLDLVVDYGWLTIIAAPLFWVLKLMYGWFGNWGLAIIGLTVLIKLIFFPLSAASYKSMAKMKQVTPRLMKIREQYADDRAKMNQAMMELYKTEKINPLGGCLPILVQIPVFIALYWVLLGSVELRYAPFYGWIKDLSAPDPFYVLPALMMISMIVQTKMNPTPPDPVQAKVMMIMPFVFGVMFFFFPAGLVLYWLVNNILSIAQQWQITRMIEGGSKGAVAKR